MKRLRSILTVLISLLIGPALGAEPARTDTHTWKPVSQWLPKKDWHYLLPPGLEYSELRFNHGDEASWATPSFDDQSWQRTTFYRLPIRTGIFWVRFRVRLPENGPDFPERIMANLTAAYDLYWDGQYIGSSGKPSNDRASEIPGIGLARLALPKDHLAASEHVVAIRMSNHLFTVPREYTFLSFAVLDPLQDEEYRWKSRIMLGTSASALVLLALTTLLLWLLAERSGRLLLLGGILLSTALLQIYQLALSYRNWNYDYLLLTANIYVTLFALIGVALVGFVSHYFAVPRRGWLMTALCVGITTWIATHQHRIYSDFGLLQLCSYSTALVCSLWAIWQKKRGAWIATSGIVTTFILLQFNVSPNLFLNSLPLYFSLIATLALDVRSRRQQAHQTELTAARLEIELLKKTLQPHFLLNTLTCLSQVVEEHPAKAVKLIDDLGAEFRTLSHLSGEKQITLEREIELCRTHLRVMSARTERNWQLETRNIDPAALVPPALFLTLIENSFSHQDPINNLTTFTLEATTTPEANYYIFFAPGRVRIRPETTSGGTGLRYLRARLDEGWPDHWNLSQGPVINGWRTIITLNTHAHAHLDR